MDKKTAIEKAQLYADAVNKTLHPNLIILYGSCAQNKNHENSDIDVAVIIDNFSGDYLKTLTLLWKLRRNISDDIEPILLDRTRGPSGFVEEVLKTGAVLSTS